MIISGEGGYDGVGGLWSFGKDVAWVRKKLRGVGSIDTAPIGVGSKVPPTWGMK